MLKSRRYSLVSLFLLSFVSCNLGSETTFLSGNSFYVNNGKGQRRVLSRNEILYKTTVYPDVTSYAYDDNFIVVKQKPERKSWISHLGMDLYGKYTAYAAYANDSNIFSQNAWHDLKGKIEGDSLNYKLFLNLGASDKNSSSDIQIRERIADSLIENDPYYQKMFKHEMNYWIIWNVKDSLIGPLTKEEYLLKRRELHIPEEVQLEND